MNLLLSFWFVLVLTFSIDSALSQATPNTVPSHDLMTNVFPSTIKAKVTTNKQTTAKKLQTKKPPTPKPTNLPSQGNKPKYLDENNIPDDSCQCNWNNSKPTQYACCKIDEPSYLEFDVLRKQIQHDTLQDLYLFKSDVYSFLFDTDHPNFTVKTIYNSNFVTGYFRVSEHEDVHIHNHTENYYLSNCEISPELLGRTLKHFPKLFTLHLEHVRLLPYPPTAVIPLNSPATVLNVMDEVYGNVNQIESLSLVDCKIYTLQMKKYYDQEHFVSLKNFTKLKILSLASNQIKSVDKIDDFLPDNGELWHLDLSHNQIVTIQLNWMIPSSVRRLDLRGNEFRFDGQTVESFGSVLLNVTELWLHIFKHEVMLEHEVNQTEIKAALNIFGKGGKLGSTLPTTQHPETTKKLI